MSDIVLYEVQGRHAVITLNRPEARNAVNGDVADGHRGGHRPARGRRRGLGRHPHRRTPRARSTGVLRRRRPQGDQLRPGRRPRHQAGRLRRLRLPRAHQADHRRRRRPRHRRRLRDRASAATSSSPPPRSSFGLAEVKRNLVAGAGGLFRLPRAIGPATSPWRPSSPASRSRPSGPTTSAWSTRLVEPGQAVDEAHARWPTRSARPRRSPCGRAARSCSAAAYEDDETLKKMTNDGFAEVIAVRGHQARASPRSSRSARRSGRAADDPRLTRGPAPGRSADVGRGRRPAGWSAVAGRAALMTMTWSMPLMLARDAPPGSGCAGQAPRARRWPAPEPGPARRCRSNPGSPGSSCRRPPSCSCRAPRSAAR